MTWRVEPDLHNSHRGVLHEEEARLTDFDFFAETVVLHLELLVVPRDHVVTREIFVHVETTNFFFQSVAQLFPRLAQKDQHIIFSRRVGMCL